MSIPTSLKSKQLLAIGLPLLICDLLVFLSCIDFGIDRWHTVDGPIRNSIDMPHTMYVPAIIILFATAVIVWFLEKDIIFTKLLVAKTTLFAAISYFSWYEFGLFSNEYVPYAFFNFQIYFLFAYYLVIANLPIVFHIYKSDVLKTRILKTATVIAVNIVIISLLLLFRTHITELLHPSFRGG